MYKHKEYSMGFLVDKKDINTSIRQQWRQIEACISHLLNYGLNGDTYRKYRRGKDRCHGCGVKTNE